MSSVCAGGLPPVAGGLDVPPSEEAPPVGLPVVVDVAPPVGGDIAVVLVVVLVSPTGDVPTVPSSTAMS